MTSYSLILVWRNVKLQPNFSWQKYEGKPEDQKEQFQYQLQQQHGVVSNSINATIDDSSYFTRERMTSFTWVDNKAIWTKTVFCGALPNAGLKTVAHGIDFTKVNQVVGIKGIAYDPVTPLAIGLNFADGGGAADSVGVFVDATNINLSTGSNRTGFTQTYVTIEFTKK